ncbi:MAG: hypothetical protein HYR67_09375 [Bacteroidetes bacterium]|nr:hypothetical protein [Bacteroidota bacterium]
MTSKLTLSVNPRVIEHAKEYAQKQGVSLSKLVEEYLSRIASRGTARSKKLKEKELSDLMKLKGIAGPVPDDFDYKKKIAEHLIKKHSAK